MTSTDFLRIAAIMTVLCLAVAATVHEMGGSLWVSLLAGPAILVITAVATIVGVYRANRAPAGVVDSQGHACRGSGRAV